MMRRYMMFPVLLLMMLSSASTAALPLDPAVYPTPPKGTLTPYEVAGASWGYAFLYRTYSSLGAAVLPAGQSSTSKRMTLQPTGMYINSLDIATVGDRAMAVWDSDTGYDPGGSGSGKEMEVHGAVMDKTAKLVTSTVKIAVNPNPSSSAGSRDAPRVAGGGGQFAVLYHHCDAMSCSGLQLIRHDTSGKAQGGPTKLGGPQTSGKGHDVAHDGTSFVVARRKSGGMGIEAQRVNAAGALVGGAISVHASADPVKHVRICAGAKQSLIVWSQETAAGNRLIRARRLSSSGALLDAGPIAVASAGKDSRYPRCSFDGAAFWISFGRQTPVKGIYLAPVSTAGVVSAPVLTLAGSAYTNHAHAGSTGLLIWRGPKITTPDDTRQEIVGAVLSAGGPKAPLSGKTLLVNPANPQRAPGLAGPGPHLAAWCDNRSGSHGVYLRSVSSAGVPLGVGATALHPPSSPDEHAWEPSVTHDGSQYLVLYRHLEAGAQTIRAAFVSSALKVSPAFVVASVPGGNGVTAVVHDGTHFVGMWRDSGIRVARITSAGKVLDSPPLSITAKVSEGKLWAAASKGTTVVTWRQDGASSEIMAARVAGGKVLDASGLMISSGAWYRRDPSVQIAGKDFLIAWGDGRLGPGKEAVFGARLSAGGVLLDKQGLQLLAPTGSYVSVSAPPVVALLTSSSGYRALFSRSDGVHRLDLDATLKATGAPVKIAPPSIRLAASGTAWLREQADKTLSAIRIHVHPLSGAATPDAGLIPDATIVDAGPAADAAMDAGHSPDATSVDAGPVLDANSTLDAMTGADGGPDGAATADGLPVSDLAFDGGAGNGAEGCTCRAGASSPAMLWLACVMLCGLLVRRSCHR